MATTVGLLASAQETPSIQLNQYEHNMAGDAFFGVPGASIGGHLVPRGMITFDYAKDPLVFVDANDMVLGEPVTAQIHLHFGFSIAFWSRLMASLDFPLAVSQEGGDAVIGGGLVQGAEDASPGDLRLGLRGNIYGEYYDPFQFGVGAYLYVPTGGDQGFTGEGTLYGQPHLLFSGRIEDFLVYHAKAGTFVRGSDNPHTFTWGVGLAGVLADEKLQIGPEAYGAIAFSDPDFIEGQITRGGSVNAEILLGAKYHFLDMFTAGLAGGPGLAEGVGTPQFRVLARLATTRVPSATSQSRRRPTVIATASWTSTMLAPTRRASPIPIRPRTAARPTATATASWTRTMLVPTSPVFAATIRPSTVARCRAIATTTASSTSSMHVRMCPASRATIRRRTAVRPTRTATASPTTSMHARKSPALRATIRRSTAARRTPMATASTISRTLVRSNPASPTKIRASTGCPRVVVTDKEILILQKVEFDFDRATIKPVSGPLLDEVAQTLIDNPDIELIEVQGHTDSKGGAFYNKALSDKRAKSVKDALIQRNVASNRLRSKGYGLEQPLASNDTEEGRATNRRVQFKILKRAKKK